MNPDPVYVLSRDGAEVCRGLYLECVAWIHRNHCYSLSHALQFEGYTLAEVIA